MLCFPCDRVIVCWRCRLVQGRQCLCSLSLWPTCCSTGNTLPNSSTAHAQFKKSTRYRQSAVIYDLAQSYEPGYEIHTRFSLGGMGRGCSVTKNNNNKKTLSHMEMMESLTMKQIVRWKLKTNYYKLLLKDQTNLKNCRSFFLSFFFLFS